MTTILWVASMATLILVIWRVYITAYRKGYKVGATEVLGEWKEYMKAIEEEER